MHEVECSEVKYKLAFEFLEEMDYLDLIQACFRLGYGGQKLLLLT